MKTTAGSFSQRDESGAALPERSEFSLVSRQHSVYDKTVSVSASGEWWDPNRLKIADEAGDQTVMDRAGPEIEH